jgi:sugar lactone lactonase YvrE
MINMMKNAFSHYLVLLLLSSLLAACGGGNNGAEKLPVEESPIEEPPIEEPPVEEPSLETPAPSASIIFPPESALVDFNLIRVRGTANDAQGDPIASVTVNGVPAESDDGFATWQAVVPVDLGENTLTVATTDNQQNSDNAAASTIVQAHPLPFLSNPGESGIEVDEANNRVLVVDAVRQALFAFDLSTGKRTVISSNSDLDAFDNQQAVGSGPAFDFPNNLELDAANHRVLLNEQSDRKVYSVDLNTGERSVLFDMNNTSGSGPALRLNRMALLDLANDRLLVLDGINRDLRLFAISLADETRTLISDNSSVPVNPNSAYVLNNPESMVLDSANNRVILADSVMESIIAINLNNGDQTVLSGFNSTDNSIVGDGPDFDRPVDVDIDTSRNQLLVTDAGLSAFFIVDLTTGDRTLLEGSGTKFIQLIAADFLGDNQIVAVDQDIETVIMVDRNTGDRNLLSHNGIGEGPRLETPRSFVQLSASQLLIADSEANHLFHMDVSNGNRSIFIDGKDTILNSPRALALDKANNRVLIIDNVDNDESSPRLLSLNLESETLSIISGGGTGTGPEMRAPESIALDSINNRLLITDSDDKALLSINLITGDRSVISDDSNQGPEFEEPVGLALKGDGNTALVVDARAGVLFSVNLQSGARSVLSGENPDTGEVIGSEFELIDSHSMILDESNNRVLISNIDGEDLLFVDLTTGIPTELTGQLSAGPFLDEPIAVIVDEHNAHHAFVLDSAYRAVFTVDILTGDRVLTSWSEVSPQNNLD